MRIWDIPTSQLCDKHLLGEHRELHAIWNILTLGKKGYSNHPETLRWIGHLRALRLRHLKQMREMCIRGFNHDSDLHVAGNESGWQMPEPITPIEEQIRLLKSKNCRCLKGD